jgi:ABC-type transporter Mla maintaining outer membrane lipid asymmetry ATPase subunit MlaF
VGKNGNRGEAPLTNILVLRDGQVYFDGTADSVLQSSDEYLKKFLVSAE